MVGKDIPLNLIFFGLVALFFIFGFCSIFLRQSTETTSTIPIFHPILPSNYRGVDPNLIQTFPTFLYSQVKHLKIGKNALECAVCLNEFEDNETLRLLPKCDHVFHRDCVDTWLFSHTSCPVCRANLSELDSIDEPLTESTEAVPEQGSINICIHVVDEETVNEELTKSTDSTAGRSKFPRSHSTGHSLVGPGENMDRFTLRLPDQAREEIMNRTMNRDTSELILPPRETSSRRGYRESYRRIGSLDRSDRWMFSMGQSGSGSQGNERRFDLIGRLSFKSFGGLKRSEPRLLTSV